MAKVIALYRTSTDEQEVESQKQDVISMAISDGYTEEEIVCIGCAGASAIKLDKKYLQNIQEVYKTIENGNIQCVYAWAIDRIGRNEEILMQFKNRLIKNKVQLKIKTVSTPLFNAEGKVDSGFEMVYAFFATVAKQEMEQKQERFERARKRNYSNGKYNGGIYAFGYCIDKNGFISINEEEAELVRLIYRKFNTGKYSTSTLAKELNELGYSTKSRSSFCGRSVCRLLKYEGYKGSFTDKKGRKHNQPAIISEEEYIRAIAIIKGNNTLQTKAFKNLFFGSKLIVCKECGYHFQALHDYYKCTGNIISKRVGHEKVCENTNTVTIRNLDGILWKLTKELLIEEIESDHSKLESETKENIEVLKQKIKVLKSKLQKYDKKIEEIVENGDILLQSEAIISRRIAVVNKQREKEAKELVKYNEELERLNSNLDSTATFRKWLTGYNSISEVELNGDEKTMYDLVHRFISKVTFERTTYNGNSNYLHIEVTTYKGIYEFYFNGKIQRTVNCFCKYPNENFFCEWQFDNIVRINNDITTEENELFREFVKRVEEIAKNASFMQEIWDILLDESNELGKLWGKVTKKNTQRAVQFINQVSLEIERNGLRVKKFRKDFRGQDRPKES